MDATNSTSKKTIVALGAALALILPSSCKDDFGYRTLEGQRVAFEVTSADSWHGAMTVSESEPTAHCTSVRALTGGDTELYLHTVVAEKPAAAPTLMSRGTPLRTTKEFKDKYTNFSLSGICYTGSYPADGEPNPWTTNYAHNLNYSTDTGKAANTGNDLFWPSNGHVRFFAFAPTEDAFADLAGADGNLELSQPTHQGSPTLTYTVPSDVKKQVDLMTARTEASGAATPSVSLTFRHALTAVQIKCGSDMLAGTIKEVTISGIYGTGTQVIGDDTWTIPEGTSTTSYSIKQDITLPSKNDKDETNPDKVHAPDNTVIAGSATDNLTFLLLPQELKDGAKMTIIFTDSATGKDRTISGSIAGQTWEAGKIVVYSISPSSINIKASVEFSKKGATADNPIGDVIPYSGVWYDVKYNPAKVEIVQAGMAEEIEEISIDNIKYQYQLEGSENWVDCTTDAGGLLKIATQPAYDTMRSKFTNTTDELGSETSPSPLVKEGEETANCYLVDQAGYYSLPLVYGNGNVEDPAESIENTRDKAKGLKYYPGYNDGQISSATISGAIDAVLCWQDAPDLIDPASVGIKNGNLVFHIRKHTLTQGNALLAVRNSSKEIIWSWHIWVTPHKKEFYEDFFTSTPDDKYSYDLAMYNLGWCDKHDHNKARKFSLRAIIDMSAYGGKKDTPVEIGTFTQDVFKGSDAGDNTYYQWGRKDPMLGGIYNDSITTYTYWKPHKTDASKSKWENDEFTMENKQVFNQYNEGGYNYSFCKNPGDKIEAYGPIGSPGEASKGVTIGYAIQHPYMFVTNSKEHGTAGHTGFNYRNHWHIPYADHSVGYLNNATHIMFNAWNSAAKDAGYEYGKTGTLANNADPVTKSIYDPCPPQFKMPPIHALQGVLQAMTSTNSTYADNVWTITKNGKSIKFPLTGVRNYALRETEWNSVHLSGKTADTFDYNEFYQISMPAFRMLTFLSSATIVKKEDYNAYQVYILSIDKSNRDNAPGTGNLKKSLTPSSNSYGLSVRPMHYTVPSTNN